MINKFITLALVLTCLTLPVLSTATTVDTDGDGSDDTVDCDPGDPNIYVGSVYNASRATHYSSIQDAVLDASVPSQIYVCGTFVEDYISTYRIFRVQIIGYGSKTVISAAPGRTALFNVSPRGSLDLINFYIVNNGSRVLDAFYGSQVTMDYINVLGDSTNYSSYLHTAFGLYDSDLTIQNSNVSTYYNQTLFRLSGRSYLDVEANTYFGNPSGVSTDPYITLENTSTAFLNNLRIVALPTGSDEIIAGSTGYDYAGVLSLIECAASTGVCRSGH